MGLFNRAQLTFRPDYVNFIPAIIKIKEGTILIKRGSREEWEAIIPKGVMSTAVKVGDTIVVHPSLNTISRSPAVLLQWDPFKKAYNLVPENRILGRKETFEYNQFKFKYTTTWL